MWKFGEIEVFVEYKEMVQFEYKGFKLELDIDGFVLGKLKYLWYNLFFVIIIIFL